MVTLKMVSDFINNELKIDISNKSRHNPLPQYRKFYYAMVYKYVTIEFTKQEIGWHINRKSSTVLQQLIRFNDICDVDKSYKAEYDAVCFRFEMYTLKRMLDQRREAVKLEALLESSFDTAMIEGIANQLIKIIKSK